MRLECGEVVIRLRGARRAAFKSDHPHAGAWSSSLAYVLVPCKTRASVLLRTRAAIKHSKNLLNRSSDAEVLLLGTPDQITALISSGPAWCRAVKKRVGQPAPQLEKYRFKQRSSTRVEVGEGDFTL